MTHVRLSNINKSFGKTQVLHDINLDISEGEFLVLVGPSGCGKSTLLRIIAGLEDTTGGDVFIGGNKVTDVEPKDRDIAMVFQNYALYPHMNVYDNLGFGLKLKKMPETEIEERVKGAADILGITEYLKRKPKELSGGQRQRVAVGRAIVRNPAVFLFDEPLSNLDAKLRVQMRTEIKRLHARLKTTMIYVTHDQVEAMTMGDRIVLLKDGYLMQADAPLELYARPSNIFVASFIGSPSMNFLDVKVEVNEGINFSNDHMKLTFPRAEYEGLKTYSGKNITLGVRPEHLELSSDNKGIHTQLEVAELMGSESYLYTRAGDSQLVARITSTQQQKTGAELNFTMEFEDLHFFDSESGERIN
ncbi:MAG: sn-glycerol-3-phosphate ABC transporter ATP-binding protein UgpC [Candidatus Marinimicrobia bacterium]|nr:sn-glycerol-3-phosphate ABC transporter ATP-binding protein UgpC [Candidatus Neomarinimicrobiota bacterium]